VASFQPWASRAEAAVPPAMTETGFYPPAELLADPAGSFDLYTCGPGPLLKLVESMASSWENQSRLHFERFATDPEKSGEAAETP
jgi:ferredoxin-NADP reductase